MIAFFFFFPKEPYIAIIGDIRHSRKIHNRAAVQDTLESVLHEINEKYAADIASRFTITLGDEFQGLLKSGENILPIIVELENKLYPTLMRFGIGVGEIVTKIKYDMAIGADGPAYHEARKAIEYLKCNEKKKSAGAANIRLETSGDEQGATELVNVVLSLLTALKYSWTDRQRQVIWAMLEHSGSQTNVAQKLGVTQSTVQKSLASGEFYTYKHAVNVVEKALGEIRRSHV